LTPPDLEPLPATDRRLRRTAVAVIALVCFAIVLGVGGSVALLFGWHPIPSTAFGCSLHCLKVTIFGREEIIQDAQKIAATGSWLDSRSDLWVENFLTTADQGAPLIVIRACNRPPGPSDVYVCLDDDWIGFNPSKRFQAESSGSGGSTQRA
jgi:hypothetical protein